MRLKRSLVLKRRFDPDGVFASAMPLTVKLAAEAFGRFKQFGGLSKSGPSPLTLI
jgi:hypothetical protein